MKNLIDVLSDESFAEEHIPGATNICVYETAFLDKVRAAFPDPDAELTIYGWSNETLEARAAQERLQAAGYRQVHILPGGLSGWKTKGWDIASAPAPVLPSGSRPIDTRESVIFWTGRNLFNFHHGSVRLNGGQVTLEHGRLTGGEFSIDMNSLACADLAEAGMNDMLVRHLKTDDFFAVDRFPEARLALTGVEYLDRASVGTPNYRLFGDFTLRGVTRELEFDALIARKPDGVFVAQALLDLDRTLFGSRYGSGKFFARLGQHVVNDLAHLRLKIVTQA